MLKASLLTRAVSPRSSTTHLPVVSGQPSLAGSSSAALNSASTLSAGCDTRPHSLDSHAALRPNSSRRVFIASIVVENTSGIASNATYGRLLPAWNVATLSRREANTISDASSTATNGAEEPCARRHITFRPLEANSTTARPPAIVATLPAGASQLPSVDTKTTSSSFRPLPEKVISVGTPTTTRSGVATTGAATLSTTSLYRMNSLVPLKR